MTIGKLGLLIISALCLAVGLIAVFGGTRVGLKAEVKVRKVDYGIPGITKAYEANLVNHSLWPIWIQYCDFWSDTATHEKQAIYEVERWDANAQQWSTIVRVNDRDTCRPYPTSRGAATLANELLWPSQSISTGEEATAARDSFAIGDKARFVIFTKDTKEQSAKIATTVFVIDEQIETEVPMRVLH